MSDTSPLSYLVLIGEVDLLSQLYGVVHIPRVVAKELDHPAGPRPVHDWMKRPPRWLKVVSLEDSSKEQFARAEPDALASLDRGERAAIHLAAGVEADLLLIDERDGRRVANVLNLPISGTIGVLDVAAAEGLVDVAVVVKKLQDTSFRASPELYRWLLRRHS